MKLLIERHNFFSIHVMVSGQNAVDEIKRSLSIKPAGLSNNKLVRYGYFLNQAFQRLCNRRSINLVYAFQHINNLSQYFCCRLRTANNGFLGHFRH